MSYFDDDSNDNYDDARDYFIEEDEEIHYCNNCGRVMDGSNLLHAGNNICNECARGNRKDPLENLAIFDIITRFLSGGF
jgi:hypothetical protein